MERAHTIVIECAFRIFFLNIIFEKMTTENVALAADDVRCQRNFHRAEHSFDVGQFTVPIECAALLSSSLSAVVEDDLARRKVRHRFCRRGWDGRERRRESIP